MTNDAQFNEDRKAIIEEFTKLSQSIGTLKTKVECISKVINLQEPMLTNIYVDMHELKKQVDNLFNDFKAFELKTEKKIIEMDFEISDITNRIND